MSGLGVKVALGVSLVVNVFIVGGIVGALYMQRHELDATRSARGGVMARAGDALAPADRDAFRQMLQAQLPTVRPIQQDAREARREALTMLAAPTFDPKAVEALMARARSDDQQARGQVETAIVDFAAKLPPAERIALVDGMRRGAIQRRVLLSGAGRGDGPQPPP